MGLQFSQHDLRHARESFGHVEFRLPPDGLQIQLHLQHHRELRLLLQRPWRLLLDGRNRERRGRIAFAISVSVSESFTLAVAKSFAIAFPFPESLALAKPDAFAKSFTFSVSDAASTADL